MQTTRAISIRQPFVELILTGRKIYEYRSTPAKIRGTVYIYASRKINEHKASLTAVGRDPDDLAKGVILGTVEIVDCKPHRTYGFAYKLSSPKRLRKFLKAKNQPQPKFWFPRF